MTVKVKICGIRHILSAQEAVNAGADFLGFNFVLSSKRFINPIRVKTIINSVKNKISTVGIFQDASLNEINEHVKFIKLDFVQLHGDYDDQIVKKIKTKVVKAFHLPEEENVQLTEEKIYKYTIHDNVDYILLDREIQGKGEMINSEKAKKLSEKFHIFLAGGLIPENIAEIVKTIKPFAVDAAGGIETNGVEDLVKIKNFIKNAKGVGL